MKDSKRHLSKKWACIVHMETDPIEATPMDVKELVVERMPCNLTLLTAFHFHFQVMVHS